MSDKSASITQAIQDVLDQRSVAALVTLIEGSSDVGAKLLVAESGTTGSLGNAQLDAAAVDQARAFLSKREDARAFAVSEFAPHLPESNSTHVLIERLQAEWRLVICGAGHVGASLAKLASLLGYQTTLIDDRPEFVIAERFPEPNIQLIAADDWADALTEAVGSGRGVSVAVVTRGHNEDEACMRAVIHAPADYIGLIGSKRRTNIVLDRLRESGATEAELKKVRAPIGLDIGAVTPEEVALSILAEIVAERRGGTGHSMSAWRRQGN
jgi:xanthine dehydrogenase accessory factor